MMNDLIQQLADEAVKAVQMNEYGVCDMNKYNQKFAELIIRECAKEIQYCVDLRIPASEYPMKLKLNMGLYDERPN